LIEFEWFLLARRKNVDFQIHQYRCLRLYRGFDERG